MLFTMSETRELQGAIDFPQSEPVLEVTFQTLQLCWSLHQRFGLGFDFLKPFISIDLSRSGLNLSSP